jgi:hypothetical protein
MQVVQIEENAFWQNWKKCPVFIEIKFNLEKCFVLSVAYVNI